MGQGGAGLVKRAFIQHHGKTSGDSGIKPRHSGLQDKGLRVAKGQKRRGCVGLPSGHATPRGPLHFVSALHAHGVQQVGFRRCRGIQGLPHHIHLPRYAQSIGLGANGGGV
jgi:hypothetical protein